MLYVVIMAGGRGERFWPLSTPEMPKPFLRFFSDRSLLQQTFDRAKRVAPAENIFLVVGEQHANLCREQIPELKADRLLLEPTGRDTAAAIGYASLSLPPEAHMLVLPADHLIPETERFSKSVHGMLAYLETVESMATFGIRPDRPETNYGYIEADVTNRGSDDFEVYSVKRFVEKPAQKRAEEFLHHASYFWNSGIFLWRVSHIQNLLARFLPDLWSGLQRIAKEPANFRQIYANLQRISIDFGVMEKAGSVVVTPAQFRWDDIGTWLSLARILPADENGNLIRGNHVGLETTDCIIYADSHTIATAGVEDLVIVQRGENILICSRRHAGRLKELLGKLRS